MKKKSVTVIIGLIMVAAMMLSACGSSSPSDVVKSDLDKLKSEEGTEEMLNSTDLDGLEKDDIADFYTKVQDFDYEILDEKVDNDKATVKVKITTYDFGSAVEKFYEEILLAAFSGSEMSDDEMTKKFLDKMSALETKDYSKEVTIKCTKKDGEWTADIDSNKDLEDALLGGLNTTIEQLDSAWE